MPSSVRSQYQSKLEELDVSVDIVPRESFLRHIDDVVRPPAVGVSLTETFDDPALSLAETTVAVDPTPVALREATTGVTGAQLGIADYGSLVLSMDDRASELVSLFVEHHVAVIRERDIVASMEAAVGELDAELTRTRGSAIIATGPSATADMGALVKGAHGPEAVHVLVVTEEE